MLIEQVEALKTWLTTKLSPICDAEPEALAKYVCALVKKDKPEQDLRDICIDQLDVFLGQNTKPFVEDLFEALKSKAYIPVTKPVIAPLARPADAKGPPVKDKEDVQKKKASEISSTTDDKENKTESPNSGLGVVTDPSNLREIKDPVSQTASVKEPAKDPRDASRDGKDRERAGSRDRRDSWRDERNRDGIRDARDIIRENREKDKDVRGGDTREVREPRDRGDYRDKDRDYRRRRTRSRSFSPRRRDFEDRLGRRRFDDRTSRYSPDRRWGRRRSWSRSPRRRSPVGRPRSRSPRGRTSRSPRGVRGSRSPVRYRPQRSRSRSRSPRPRSWSRPGSGGMAARLRSRSLSNSRQPDSRGSTPLQDNDFISSSTNDATTVTSTVSGLRPLEGRLGEPTIRQGPPPVAARARCQNFEEKGFCMLGDVCPYDHGTDPVVVEDDAIGLGPGANLDGPDLRIPPPGLGMQLNTNLPPPNVEPYLPEAPGLQVPLRPQFLRGPPPDLRRPPPGMPGPPDVFSMQRREVIMGRPPLGINDRELLESGGPPRSETSRIVIPSKRPYSAIDGDATAANLGPPPARIPHLMFDPTVGPPPPLPQQPLMPLGNQSMQQGPMRKGFDYSRLGGRGFKHQGPNKSFKFTNMTLEVRKIPIEMNNIAKLNEHFGKFGTLTNIQVKYQGDAGAALISFSTNAEAAAAYKSPEPVFNNRFIKLFWHNAEKPLSLDGERELGPVVTTAEGEQPQHQQQIMTGGRVGDGIDHPSLVLPVRPTIPPAHKMTLDNTKGKQKEPIPTNAGDVNEGQAADTKSIVYTSSMGYLKKTVFNPTATTPTTPTPKPKPTTPVSPAAVKPSDYVSRMEAIKRIEEERKLAPAKQAEIDQKKQELLAKQIEQQKKLLETLEKKKDVLGEPEKQMLRTALRKISDAIDTVKYGTGAKRIAAPVAPQQFKYSNVQEQNRKAILDLDLEVINKQGRGEDTTALRLKLQELAKAGTPAHGAAPASYGRGRGSYGWAPRGGRGRGWTTGHAGRTSLDKRPRTVEVKGFELTEIDEIRAHFQRFGEIEKEDLQEEVPSAFFTFALRQSAEMAVAQGAKLKKKTLVVRWNQVTPKITRTESSQSSEFEENLSVTLGSLDNNSVLSSPVSTPVELKDGQEIFAQRSVDNSSTLADTALLKNAARDIESDQVSSKGASIERSLSEDLLAGAEENFKASYSEDDDEEDHITVTLSNTSTNAPTIYTSSGNYKVNTGNQAPTEAVDDEEDDLSNLDPGPALDFIEEPQV